MFVLILLIFAVYIIAYTTLNKLFAVFLYIIFAVLLKFEKSTGMLLHTSFCFQLLFLEH